MKRLFLPLFTTLSLGVHAQTFQLGYMVGIINPYNILQRSSDDPTTLVFVQNGIFGRYETKGRLEVSLSASEYTQSFSNFELDNEPENQSTGQHAISIYHTDITHVNNYIFELSLQCNINTKKALHNPNFKGIKSYLGISYSGTLSQLRAHAVSYDAIANESNYQTLYGHEKEDAVGINYYGAYNISRHVVVSLSLGLRLRIASLDDNDPDFAFAGVAYNSNRVVYDGASNIANAVVGLAYKFGK